MGEWSTLSVYQKARLVMEINAEVGAGESVAEACAERSVDRSTYYRWRERVARYEAGDRAAIQPRPSSPRRHGRQTPDNIREEVVRLAKTGRFASPTAIARHLTRQGTPIHAGTVIGIVEDAGLYGYVTKTLPNGESKKVRGWIGAVKSVRDGTA